MAQGFTQGLAIPLTVSQGGTSAVTAAGARDNLVLPSTSMYANNIIIGGDFTTNPWQRGTSIAGIVNNQYSADRFISTVSGSGIFSVIKTSDGPTVSQAEVYSPNCLHVDVTTADGTIGASDKYAIGTYLEGINTAKLGFGQTGAATVTLSFWHKHTITGTYCVSFLNSAEDRSYVAEYTQAVTDTWEKATITVVGDTTGTWLYTAGTKGLDIFFAIAAGSTSQTTANSWQAGGYLITSNQVNGMSSTANNFKLALIKLELGTFSTPFSYESEQQVLAQCQRYFQRIAGDGLPAIATGYSSTTSAGYFTLQSKVPMANSIIVTNSTISQFSVLYAAASSVATAFSFSNQSHDYLLGTIAVTGTPLTVGQGFVVYINNSAGYIDLSAGI